MHGGKEDIFNKIVLCFFILLCALPATGFADQFSNLLDSICSNTTNVKQMSLGIYASRIPSRKMLALRAALKYAVQQGIHVKVLKIIINHSNAGFFAYFTFALNQLLFAEQNGFFPVIFFGSSSGCEECHEKDGCEFCGPNAFYDANQGRNMWDYFFEQPGLANIEYIHDLIENGANISIHKLSHLELWNLHLRERHSVYTHPYGFYEETEPHTLYYSHVWYEKQRHLAAGLIWDYVRMKPAVVRRLRLAVATVKSSITLGVHMRGSDKGIWGGARKVNRLVHPEEFFPLIDSFFARCPPNVSSIFLATDQVQYRTVVSQRYGADPVCFSPAEALSMDGGSAFRSTSVNGFSKGMEVLLDTLLLSRSSLMIKSSGSAVSAFTAFFNPALPAVDVAFHPYPPSPSPPTPPLRIGYLLAYTALEPPSQEDGSSAEDLVRGLSRALRCGIPGESSLEGTAYGVQGSSEAGCRGWADRVESLAGRVVRGGRAEEAVVALESLLHAGGLSPRGRLNLAAALHTIGRHTAAAAAAETAYETGAGPRALVTWASALDAAGFPAGARGVLLRYLRTYCHAGAACQGPAVAAVAALWRLHPPPDLLLPSSSPPTGDGGRGEEEEGWARREECVTLLEAAAEAEVRRCEESGGARVPHMDLWDLARAPLAPPLLARCTACAALALRRAALSHALPHAAPLAADTRPAAVEKCKSNMTRPAAVEKCYSNMTRPAAYGEAHGHAASLPLQALIAPTRPSPLQHPWGSKGGVRSMWGRRVVRIGVLAPHFHCTAPHSHHAHGTAAAERFSAAAVVGLLTCGGQESQRDAGGWGSRGGAAVKVSLFLWERLQPRRRRRGGRTQTCCKCCGADSVDLKQTALLTRSSAGQTRAAAAAVINAQALTRPMRHSNLG